MVAFKVFVVPLKDISAFVSYYITTPNTESDDVMSIPPSASILCGYWYEWEPRVPLEEIPAAYNPVCVAFLEGGSAPRYEPLFYSRAEIIRGVQTLKAQGREVLISMGGADGHISLNANQKSAFKDGLVNVLDTYGFTGADIDLEGGAIRAGDNGTVIPAVLREIKEMRRARGESFLITLAPEFRYLRGYDAGYKPYIEDFNGYYDFVWPQYYNQGADGVWSDELGIYLSQNDNEFKSAFLYTLTHAIVTGAQDFIRIPADKFVIGLPASRAAALNGYVTNPEDVRRAMTRLTAEGNKIRGLMTWSVNHDFANGYQFMNSYAP